MVGRNVDYRTGYDFWTSQSVVALVLKKSFTNSLAGVRAVILNMNNLRRQLNKAMRQRIG